MLSWTSSRTTTSERTKSLRRMGGDQGRRVGRRAYRPVPDLCQKQRETQVMDLDEPGLVVVADAPEGADQIARFDRPPVGWV